MAGRQGRRRFGAIRRLPSGRYQVRYRTVDGRYVTAPTTFEAKADAGRYLSKIETDMLRGEWADPRLGRTTFGEWADLWLDSTVNLRANMKAGYRSILSRYLRPAFGTYPLARIDVLAVRTWLAKLEADGVGQATRAKAYRLLARILGSAVEARFLAVNPCGSGCRRAIGRWSWWPPSVGCAGASWPGYAASASTWSAARSRWPSSSWRSTGPFSVGPPKSAAGRRAASLPAVVVEALGEHLRSYTAKSPEAFVFLSSQGTHLRRSNFNRRVWQPATRAAGVEGLRVHDLRHTAGTLATAAGGSLREVMDRLGHSTTVAAVRYQHVMADRDAAIARELNRLIEGA